MSTTRVDGAGANLRCLLHAVVERAGWEGQLVEPHRTFGGGIRGEVGPLLGLGGIRGKQGHCAAGLYSSWIIIEAIRAIVEPHRTFTAAIRSEVGPCSSDYKRPHIQVGLQSEAIRAAQVLYYVQSITSSHL